MMINDRLLHAQIPVYVYVNTRAISAGAMIAVSADHVGVHPGAAIGAALPVVPAAPGEGPSSQAFKAADSKVVSVLAAQMRAAAEAKGHPQDIAAAMVDPDKPVAGYGAPGEPLTLTAQEALKAGLAEVEADTFESFLEKMGLGDAQIVRPELTLAERAAAQLSRPLFASMLIGLAFILLIIEAKTPGVGLPLAGSIVCFALAQYGSLMADLSGWLEPALLMVGLTLLAIEIFITPGFGLLGLTGIGCIFTGIAFSMSNMPMSAAGIMQHWIGPSVYAILGSLVAAMVGLPVVLKILPHIPYLNGLALEAPEDDRLAQPLPDRLEALKVGMLGVADTDCRPSGSARFGEQRFDVLSEGRFIRKGTFVAIKEISGSRVVVAPKSLDAI
jgi:membrane-bound serine protease (ClpP class)